MTWKDSTGTVNIIGKTEKVSFSSGSESRDTIRRADLLRNSRQIVVDRQLEEIDARLYLIRESMGSQ